MYVSDRRSGEIVVSPVVEILERARQRVERGWCQRPGRKENGDTCPGNAITDQLAEGYRLPDVQAACDAYLAAIGHNSIAAWNDMPARTKEEVLAGFDRAIRGLKMGLSAHKGG